MAPGQTDRPYPLNRAVGALGTLLLVTALTALGATDAAAAPRHKTPTPTITDRPAAQTNARSATFRFTDSLDGVSFSCALDHLAYSPCTSPTTYSGPLASGPHSFRVRATAPGHTRSRAARAGWTVDLVAPPAPTLSGIPTPSPTGQTGATLTLSDAEHDVTFLCALDNADPAKCTSPVTLTGLTDGVHTFSVLARDPAGNLSPATRRSWQVDGTAPPVPTITTGPADPTDQTSATFAVADLDPSATLTCSLDGGTYAPCGPTATYISLATGPHTFDLRASDEVGNHSDAPQFGWTIDLTAPTPPSIDSGPAAITDDPVGSFTFTLPAGATQLRCSLDGAAYADCASPFSTPSLADGPHSLLVLARDAVNNESGATPWNWTVDTVAPTAVVTAPRSLRATVTATFSEPVHGVTSSSLMVRVAHTTVNRAARLTCHTADAISAPCGEGPVTIAKLKLRKALTPGQKYVVIANPAGHATIADPAGNRVARTAKPFRALTHIQENSAAARYAWGTVHAAAAYGGSYRTERNAGASATYRFTGAAITWYTATGPKQGIARVYLDGVRKPNVNNYAAAPGYKVPHTLSGLGSGRHTLRIVATGRKGAANGRGTFIAIDAVKVPHHTVMKNPTLKYKWRFAAVTTASGGGVALTNVAHDSTSLTFKGKSIAWYTSTGRNRGIAKVYLDGRLRATVDLYRATKSFGVRRLIGNLKNAVHTVRIVVTGHHRAAATGSVVVLDRWVVG